MRVLLVGLLFALAMVAWGHPANIPTARAKVDLEGAVHLRLRFDMLAFVLDETPVIVADPPMNALLDGPRDRLDAGLRDAQERMRQNLQVLGDGRLGKIDSLEFPTAAQVHEAADGKQPRLPVMMTVDVVAHLPAGAKTSAFRFPDVLGSVVLTTEFPYEEPISEPVTPGATSTSLALPTPAQVAAVQATIAARAQRDHPAPSAPAPPPATGVEGSSRRGDGSSRRGDGGSRRGDGSSLRGDGSSRRGDGSSRRGDGSSGRGDGSSGRGDGGSRRGDGSSVAGPPAEAAPLPIPMIRAPRPAWTALFPGYVRMGFLHIVPQGLDHILFVLGLFLLSRRTKDLLKQITAFTVAHSLTLALSLYGVIRLPSSVVEPIIAASIVFVAVENILAKEMKRWRVGVVFLFGLMHGLGFASALQEAGLSRADFLPALFGFNCGVELGQLAVVAAALLLVGWFRSHRSYRVAFAIPASVMIAAVALFWTIQRLV